MKERIQKVLSEQGYCSRRAAEKLIQNGKVTVNGHPALLGDKVDPVRDIVAVSGQRLYFQRKVEKVCYALNKPRGYVTTLSDEKGRKCVSDLLSEEHIRLFPIGRLDKDSEGLLLMTNDGELANLVSHPSRGVKKVYRVSVSPAPSEEILAEIVSGVPVDGGKLAPESLRVLSEGTDRASLEFVLKEGKNREIRRICEAVGLEVIRLKRVSIGPILLGGLQVGKYRQLTKQEVISLRGACRKKKT